MTQLPELKVSFGRSFSAEEAVLRFLIQRLHEGLEPDLYGHADEIRRAVSSGRALMIHEVGDRLVGVGLCDQPVGGLAAGDQPSLGPLSSIFQSRVLNAISIDVAIATALVFQPEFDHYYALASIEDPVLTPQLQAEGFQRHGICSHTIQISRKPRAACAVHAARLLALEERGWIEDSRGLRYRLKFDLDVLSDFRDDLVQAAFASPPGPSTDLPAPPRVPTAR